MTQEKEKRGRKILQREGKPLKRLENLAISKELWKVLLFRNPSLQEGNGHVDVALDSDSSIIAFLRQLWRNAVEPVIQLWREVGRRSNRLPLKFHRKLFSLAVGKEVFFDGASSSDVIWFGVCEEMLVRERERTSGTRHGQTSHHHQKPHCRHHCSAAAFSRRAALRWRKGTLRHSFKSVRRLRFQIPGAKKRLCSRFPYKVIGREAVCRINSTFLSTARKLVLTRRTMNKKTPLVTHDLLIFSFTIYTALTLSLRKY